MHSADVAFSQVDSWTGHAVENCSNRVLMSREHEQVFSLHHERGIDRSSRHTEFTCWVILWCWSYITPRLWTEDYDSCCSLTETAMFSNDFNPCLDVDKITSVFSSFSLSMFCVRQVQTWYSHSNGQLLLIVLRGHCSWMRHITGCHQYRSAHLPGSWWCLMTSLSGCVYSEYSFKPSIAKDDLLVLLSQVRYHPSQSQNMMSLKIWCHGICPLKWVCSSCWNHHIPYSVIITQNCCMCLKSGPLWTAITK